MRLFLLLFFLPLVGHTQPASVQPPKKREIRVGVSTQIDGQLQQPYIATNNVPVLRMDRPSTAMLAIDYQVSKDEDYLFLTGGFSYYQLAVPGDEPEFYLDENRVRRGYQEEVSSNYLQFSLGVKIELFGTSKCSPFLEADLLYARPFETTYTIQFDETSDRNFPNYLRLEGGTRASLGFQLRSGLRYYLHPRLSLGAGFFYANLHLRQGWPDLPRRSLTDTFMRLDNGGFEFSLKYRFNQKQGPTPVP